MKGILTLLLLATLFTSCGVEIVDDGYVGIRKTNGKVQKEELNPGIHFYMPIISNVFEMETREKAWKGEVSGFSSDTQIVKANFKANYRPQKSQMAELFIDKGSDYTNVILPQRVTAPLKEIIGNYKATDLITSRGKISVAVADLIRKRLVGTSIDLISFEVTNFDFDDEYEKSIKNKIVQKELALAEVHKTNRVIEKNKQKRDTDETEANGIKVKAAALAKSKDLIQLEAVKKWNGILPQYMMGGSATPFINLNGIK